MSNVGHGWVRRWIGVPRLNRVGRGSTRSSRSEARRWHGWIGSSEGESRRWRRRMTCWLRLSKRAICSFLVKTTRRSTRWRTIGASLWSLSGYTTRSTKGVLEGAFVEARQLTACTPQAPGRRHGERADGKQWLCRRVWKVVSWSVRNRWKSGDGVFGCVSDVVCSWKRQGEVQMRADALLNALEERADVGQGQTTSAATWTVLSSTRYWLRGVHGPASTRQSGTKSLRDAHHVPLSFAWRLSTSPAASSLLSTQQQLQWKARPRLCGANRSRIIECLSEGSSSHSA
jgi:hypothetical protein